jgi:bifunctional DNase/RNase
MVLLAVQLRMPANTPVMVLREDSAQGRLLPILIGAPEAASIHTALEGIEPPRPLTHDLAITLLHTLGATLERVVITEMREHTFYAELHLRTATGESVVGCRPSDAVALAVRCSAAIFADDDLLEAEGVEAPVDDEDDVDEEAILDEFRDFLDEIRPDDFNP